MLRAARQAEGKDRTLARFACHGLQSARTRHVPGIKKSARVKRLTLGALALFMGVRPWMTRKSC